MLIFLGILLRTSKMKWCLDSVCSGHIKGDKSKLIELQAKVRGHVTYSNTINIKFLVFVLWEIHPEQLLKMYHMLRVLNTTCWVLVNCATKVIKFLLTPACVFKDTREDNVYFLDLDHVTSMGAKCLTSKSKDS